MDDEAISLANYIGGVVQGDAIEFMRRSRSGVSSSMNGALEYTGIKVAEKALAWFAPIRADLEARAAAAEARGLERAREVVADCRNSAASEQARSDDWQDGVLTGMDTVGFAIFAEINAIKRGEHDTGKEG